MEQYFNIVKEFNDVLKCEENNHRLFSNRFFYQMLKEAIDTLENIYYLITAYQTNYSKDPSAGNKVLNLFGLLQGLFVAIDCLYTIGRATNINKIMININQNNVLRSIKHIRNDVVGHPAYRYYENNAIGFCSLDLHNINGDELVYKTVIFFANNITEESHTVRMLEVIMQFFIESSSVLNQTLQFLKMKKAESKWYLAGEIAKLGSDYLNGINNFDLLKKIENDFITKMALKIDSNHRVLWRIKLIFTLFNKQKNEYLFYLTILEIYKLYSLLYQLEKQINSAIKFYFPSFIPNSEFVLLKKAIKKDKKRLYDPYSLHDNSHPLFRRNFEVLLEQYQNDEKTSKLRSWIKEELIKNDRDILYLIGSELKLK